MKRLTIIFILTFVSVVKLYGNQNNVFLDGNHFFMGYTVNIPTEYFGLSILYTRPKTVGFIVEAKLSLPGKPEPYYSTITQWEAEVFYGDPKLGSRETYLTTNIGLTYTFSKRFGFYSGMGYTIYTEYNQYDDPTNILGDTYWIEVNEINGFNFLGGFLIGLIKNVASHIGLETNPFGITLGLDFKIDYLFE